MPVAELCEEFQKKLRVPLEPEKYDEALDEIFNSTSKDTGSDYRDKEETVITRAYQDHQASKKHLAEHIKTNLSFSISLFETFSNKSVHVLIGVFDGREDTIPLLKELEYRIKSQEDKNIHFLLSCVLQLLNKFEYSFDDLGWLIRTLCLRFDNEEVRSMGLVIFSQLDMRFHDEFEPALLLFLEGLVTEAESDIGDDPVSLVINILTELYPAFTALCSSIILGKDLDRLLQDQANTRSKDESFLKKLFKLLIVACIDETVRNNIAENYLNIIEVAMQTSTFEVYCALILIKTWSFTKLKNVTVHDLTTILIDTFLNNVENPESDEVAFSIEGLAYLSLKTSVKLILRHHSFFCPKVVEIVKENKFKDHNFYGLLIILANLGTPPNDPKLSGKTSLKDLKSYANLQHPNSMNDEDIKDDKTSIKKFNQINILDTELVSGLKPKMSELSSGSQEQLVRIIYNITRYVESIATCVQQGYTIIILEYLINTGNPKKRENLMIRVLALRSLCKILIHTDPQLIFNKFSSLNTLTFLFEMLPSADLAIQNETHLINEDYLTTTDQYESLLALTNLASSPQSDGEEMCKAIGSNAKYWNIVENLMLDDNPVLQRADLELISNLMSHPISIAVKFFNFDNKQSKRNFEILVKLLLLDDVKSQRAVAAIFATISNMIPFVTQELLKQEVLIKNAITAFVDQIEDSELIRRLLMLFYALFELAPEESSQSYATLAKIKDLPEMDDLRAALTVLLEQNKTKPNFSETSADENTSSSLASEDIEVAETVLNRISKE